MDSDHDHPNRDSPTQPRIKRHRVDIACSVCKVRKIRCDGVRPVCGPCSKRQLGVDVCLYRDEGQRNVISARKQNSDVTQSSRSRSRATGTGDSQHHDDHADSYPHAHRPPASTGSGAGAGVLPSENIIGAYAGLDFLRHMKDAVESHSHADGTRGEASLNKGNNVLPRLPRSLESWEVDNTQYVLPTRKVADRLLRTYWDYADIIFPLLDRPVIDAGYESLWTNGQEMAINEKAFHCILNLMFAVACCIGSIEDWGPRYQSANSFFERARSLMAFNLFDMKHPELIQISLLTALYLQNSDQPRKFSHSVSLAIHIAQELGLHIPATVKSLASPDDRRLARRLWLGCIAMDRITAMTFGSKLKISQAVAREAVFCNNSQEPLLPAQDGRSADVGFYTSTCQLYHILGEVLETFYEATDTPATIGRSGASGNLRHDNMAPEVLANLFRIESSLHTWRNGLNYHLQISSNQNNQDNMAPITRQANILHTRYLHVRLLLYRPFFSVSHLLNTPHVDMEDQSMNSVISSCQTKCIHAARDIIEFIFNNSANRPKASSVYVLPSDWYNISYIYMAATVLIATKRFPAIVERSSVTSIDAILEQAYSLLQNRGSFTDVAQKCRTMLESFHENILSSARQSGGTHADQSIPLQPPPSGPQLGDVISERQQLEAGHELSGGMDYLQGIPELPLFWNQWPSSLLSFDPNGF